MAFLGAGRKIRSKDLFGACEGSRPLVATGKGSVLASEERGKKPFLPITFKRLLAKILHYFPSPVHGFPPSPRVLLQLA